MKTKLILAAILAAGLASAAEITVYYPAVFNSNVTTKAALNVAGAVTLSNTVAVVGSLSATNLSSNGLTLQTNTATPITMGSLRIVTVGGASTQTNQLVFIVGNITNMLDADISVTNAWVP